MPTIPAIANGVAMPAIAAADNAEADVDEMLAVMENQLAPAAQGTPSEVQKVPPPAAEGTPSHDAGEAWRTVTAALKAKKASSAKVVKGKVVRKSKGMTKGPKDMASTNDSLTFPGTREQPAKHFMGSRVHTEVKRNRYRVVLVHGTERSFAWKSSARVAWEGVVQELKAFHKVKGKK